MKLIQRFFKNSIDAAVQKQLQTIFSQSLNSSIRILNNGVIYNDDGRSSYIRDGYDGNATVYSIVSQQAEKASTVPILLYEVKDKKAFERYKLLASGITTKSLAETEKWKRKALEEVQGHEVIDLLNRPNPVQSANEFKEQMIGYMKLTGAGLASKLKLDSGKIQELNIIPTHFIGLETEYGNGYAKIVKYVLNIGVHTEWEAEEVIHVRYPDYNWTETGQHLLGMSPLRAGWRTRRRNYDSEMANMKLLQNGGSKGLLVPKDDTVRLDEPQADALDERLNQKVNGVQNKGAIAVGQVALDYLNFGLTAVEQDILNTEKYTDEKLCRLFKHPPVLLMTERATLANYEEGLRQLITQVIYNDVSRLAQAFNQSLLPEYKDLKNAYFAPDITGLPEMQKDIKEIIAAGRDAYWLSFDEKRSLTGYDSDPEHGKKYFIPSGLIEINDMGLDDPLADVDAQNNEFGNT